MGLGKALVAAAMIVLTALPACAPKVPPPPPAMELVAPPRIEPRQADRVVIHKQRRRLLLMADGQVFREYRVALGFNPVGHKVREGDGRTPEGLYHIDLRKRDSNFHRALRISYPDDDDIRRAAARGVSPGGAIMIHGLPNGKGWVGAAHSISDWTDGCIAVSNDEMDEIWRMVPLGVPVEILP